MIYLDTNVVVAYYCPEPMSELAESMVRGKHPCFISDLTEVEFFSAISRKVRQRELTNKQAAGVRHHFANHLSFGVYRRNSLACISHNCQKKGVIATDCADLTDGAQEQSDLRPIR